MLSGGERALTGVALLFAMLTVNPVPFCILDEVDAALDEANIGRFAEALRKLSRIDRLRRHHPQPGDDRGGRYDLRRDDDRCRRQPRPLAAPGRRARRGRRVGVSSSSRPAGAGGSSRRRAGRASGDGRPTASRAARDGPARHAVGLRRAAALDPRRWRAGHRGDVGRGGGGADRGRRRRHDHARAGGRGPRALPGRWRPERRGRATRPRDRDPRPPRAGRLGAVRARRARRR